MCVNVYIYIYNLYVCVWIYKGKRIRRKRGMEGGKRKKEGRGNWWFTAVRDQTYLPLELSSSNRQWVINRNTRHVRANSRMIDPVCITLFTFEDAGFQLCRCFSRANLQHTQSKTRNTGRSLFINSHSSSSYRLSFLSSSHGP